jgi:hypothetical protein
MILMWFIYYKVFWIALNKHADCTTNYKNSIQESYPNNRQRFVFVLRLDLSSGNGRTNFFFSVALRRAPKA